MRFFAAAVVAVGIVGCSDTVGEPIGAAVATACGCHVDGSAPQTLVMSWSCYCAVYGGCERTLASDCFRQGTYLRRWDYPGCQLSLLATGPYGSWNEDFFDADGKLVGVTMASDTSTIKCPDEPSIGAWNMKAGRTPTASCQQITCGGGCTAESFPCAGTVDGGFVP
jgi:hypothetical protein